MPKKFKPFVPGAFASEEITWESPVKNLRYIGNHLSNQLNAAGIYTLNDVILYLSDTDDLGKAAKLIAELTRSPSINECKGMDKNPPQPYLPRAFNRMGFNALADLLHYACTHNDFADDIQENLDAFREQVVGDPAKNLAPGDVRGWLIREFNENDGANLGNNPETKAMRRCPCWKTAGTCNADAGCQWVPGSHQNPLPGCVPQFMIAAGGNMAAVRHRVTPLDVFPNTPAGRAAMQEGDWRFRGVAFPGPNGGFLVRIPVRQSQRPKRRRTGNT